MKTRLLILLTALLTCGLVSAAPAQTQGGRKKVAVVLRVACAQQSDKVNTLLDRRTLIGVQGAYYYNTMFGPLGATLGYSNRTKEVYFYINLGYEF